MLKLFGCVTLAFALAANHQIPRYWTKMDSAWQRFWSKEVILGNPLFEWLEQLVQKFIRDKASCILHLLDYSSKMELQRCCLPGRIGRYHPHKLPPSVPHEVLAEEKWKGNGSRSCKGGTRAV